MGSVSTILQANNITRIKQAEYEAKTMMQRADNKKEAAKVALAEFSRSLGNTLRIEAAGKEFNEATSNLAASLEGRTTNRLNSSLAAAERMGALAAQAGAMGVGGSSVGLLSDTIKLQRNIEQDLQQQATTRLASQGSRANAQIMDNAYNQIDLQQTFGSFDHTVYVAPMRMKNRLGALLGAAVATYFGGPMAGMAVADLAVGAWQADNANFQGASQSLDAGIQHALKGYQTWSSLQGGDGPKSWFGAVTQRQNQQADAKAARNQTINWGGFTPGSDDFFGSGFGDAWSMHWARVYGAQ